MPEEKLDYFNLTTRLEERNIQKTRKHFSKELEFWKETFNMLYEVFESITKSYSKEWSYSKRACFFLLPRLIMSSKTSLELLTKGYYFDYIVVERSFWESTALLMLFSKDEEAAKKWFNFGKLDIPKWKLMHRLFPGSPTKKLTARIDKAYAVQSDYAHSSFFAVFSEFLKHLTPRKRFFRFPRFEKSLIADTISTPPSALALIVSADLFRDELGEDFRKRAMDFVGEKLTDWEARGLLKKEDFE